MQRVETLGFYSLPIVNVSTETAASLLERQFHNSKDHNSLTEKLKAIKSFATA